MSLSKTFLRSASCSSCHRSVPYHHAVGTSDLRGAERLVGAFDGLLYRHVGIHQRQPARQCDMKGRAVPVLESDVGKDLAQVIDDFKTNLDVRIG